ncbi:hypothetical protein [Streptomyces antarcticus]|uniref:hypothetical protein n=1 Tax=Streptomyces antarcticus TaxID=2996458 RepID=UPI00226E4E4F|nr:hypothetical protein [Streptomyces sp. H34-AA3]MCY0940676.1 hypothetical protein [Streptomyces sp. H34-AA3]
MISEPEIDTEWDGDGGRGPGAAGSAAAGPDEGAAAGSVRGRPWWWALGGAVAASAVWGGVLVGLEYRDGEEPPPTAYRISQDLCREAPLSALARAAGRIGPTSPSLGESPAADWAYCSYVSSAADSAAEELVYGAELLVELHKKADPEAEFAAGPGLTPHLRRGAVRHEEVAGLGERALITDSVGDQGPQLHVLDGGAVFTLSVQWSTGPDDAPPDEDAIKAAVIEDVRALMAVLKD